MSDKFGKIFIKNRITGKMLFDVYYFTNCIDDVRVAEDPNLKDEYNFKGKYVILSDIKLIGKNHYRFKGMGCFAANFGINYFEAEIKRRETKVCWVDTQL